MPTYAELNREAVWRTQFVPQALNEHLIVPLRNHYGLGPTVIGAPGDNNHLYGRHRSRNWALTSIYCTNRSYGTTDARDKRGDGDWYRAVDVGVTGQTLYDACRRIDAAVRAGELPGLAEWFGTFDGRTVVGWYQGRPSSSDSSHLTHFHGGFWNENANDVALMQKVFRIFTGTGAAPTRYRGDQMNFIVDETKTVYGVSSDHTRVWAFTDVNLLARCLDMNGNPTPTRVFQNEITSGMYGRYEGIYWQSGKPRGPESVEVVLDDAALAEIAAAAEKGAAEGAPSAEEIADAVVEEIAS